MTGGRLVDPGTPTPAWWSGSRRIPSTGPPTSWPLRPWPPRKGPMNPGNDWMEQGRRLLEALGSGRSTPRPPRPTATHGSDCRWCPVCQAAAVVRGERPELTAALADVLAATATALRTFAAEAAGAPGADAGDEAEPEDGDPPGGPADRDRVTGRDAAGLAALGIDIGGTKVAGGVVAPDGTILATARRATPGASVGDTEDAIAAVVEELAAGHDGELVGVGIGAAGWFDRTGDTVLFSPHLAWRNSTPAQGPDRPAAAAALGGQRRRRRGLGRVPLRRRPGSGPGADDHAGHGHRRRHRAGRPAAAGVARRGGGVGPHAGRARRPALRLRQPRLLGAVRQRHGARPDRPRGRRYLPCRGRPAAGARGRRPRPAHRRGRRPRRRRGRCARARAGHRGRRVARAGHRRPRRRSSTPRSSSSAGA